MKRLMQDLKTGELKSIYLLCGEEAYLRKQYRDKIRDAVFPDGDSMNYHYYEGKGIITGEIIDLAETMPFFAEKRLIIMENSGLLKSGGEQMADYVKEAAETAILVFVETEIDKRSRLYKAIHSVGAIAEFPAQDESTLKRWVLGILKKEGKQITERTLLYFLEKTGTDMANIRSELDKLICYCLDKEVIDIADVEQITVSQTTNQIFEMINAIADKKKKAALGYYYDLLAQKEPSMRILFLIGRQFNTLLQVKELKKKGYDNKTIGAKVGLPGFIAGKYCAQAQKFTTRDLRDAVESCVAADEAIKTGRMNDIMSVELLIVKYSS